MTNEQINIAIAEHCGWKQPDDPDVIKFKQGWTMPEKLWILKFKYPIRDYCNDLDAMYEAENSFDGDVLDRYMDYCMMESEQLECYTFRLPADGRARAFVKTIGKWEES